MRCHQFLIGLVFFLSCVCTWAREVTDTLESIKGDRVFITYDITENNGHVDIRFLDVYKKLGATFKDKYWNLKEIVVLFFDRIGNYEDNMKFSGINVEALMIPKEINYTKSKDGYFFLHDKPAISLELTSEESAELSIPMFLAHYEGKRSYKVFSRCDNLVIKLSKKKSSKEHDVTNQQLMTQTTILENITEETDNDESLAEFLIKNKITVLLAEQEEFPFSEELNKYIEELQKIQLRNISNQSLSDKIDGVLEDCKQKEQDLKAKAKAEAEAKEKADSQRLADMQRQEQARQDSIAVVAQQQAEKDSKRNLWLIVGGVILAVLGFTGNQIFQHFRNVKSQKDFMAMQENVVKRAEDEAKRRARNMAQSQVNRLRSEARQETRNAINAGINKIKQKGKGNKGISI